MNSRDQEEALLDLERILAIEDCIEELKRENLDNFSTHWRCGFNHALTLLQNKLKAEKNE